jgi:hypothetical protein
LVRLGRPAGSSRCSSRRTRASDDYRAGAAGGETPPFYPRPDHEFGVDSNGFSFKRFRSVQRAIVRFLDDRVDR